MGRHAFVPTTLEPRLQQAYVFLVKGFSKVGSRCSPGPVATVGGVKPATFSQKLWRFCKNRQVRSTTLIEPLHQAIGHEADAGGVLLAVHDWSTLSFQGHRSKTDRATLTHKRHKGYDLATVLMVRAQDGTPIAPAQVTLRTAHGVLSTREDRIRRTQPHIDQVLPGMRLVRELNLRPPVVHVIDREADSVRHWRQWSADGFLALVRADDRIVRHKDRETRLSAIADALRAGGTLHDAGPVSYRGRPARLFVGEAFVVLHRPGRRNVGRKKKVSVPRSTGDGVGTRRAASVCAFRRVRA
jgi:hypothetical protein